MIKRVFESWDKQKKDGDPYVLMRIEGGLLINVWNEDMFQPVRDIAKVKGQAEITIVKKGDFYSLKAFTPVIQTKEQLKESQMDKADRWAPWPINQSGMLITAAQKNAVNLTVPLLEERKMSSADQAVNMVNEIAARLYKWLMQKAEEAIYLYEHSEPTGEEDKEQELEVEVTEEMVAQANPAQGSLPNTKDEFNPEELDKIPDGLKTKEQEEASAQLAKHGD